MHHLIDNLIPGKSASSANLFSLALILLSMHQSVLAKEHMIIVSGLGGDVRFQANFNGQARQLYDAAISLGLDESQVQLLSNDDANKKNIISAISSINSSSEDFIQVHLIGHGSFDGIHYKFNVPGPDITDTELADELNELAGTQMVALMSSSSGAAMERLRGDNRLVITATKSGLQKNASVFSRFWAEGADRNNTDLNKNEIISVAELYSYTSERVRDYYESEGLIASEASLFESPPGINADLFNISRIGQLAKAVLSVQAEALIAERANVEVKLSELSSRRQALSDDDYFAELQDLMLELGLLQQQIDRELEQEPDSQNIGGQE
tara:strand:- start:37603 stop:38580 length:978 start_codon:yes stop_codon:yes gene_type:complete